MKKTVQQNIKIMYIQPLFKSENSRNIMGIIIISNIDKLQRAGPGHHPGGFGTWSGKWLNQKKKQH
ncbi:hypothetical protein [Desulfobacter vibrioformis]|uniref:hypothetical protein n=1 Tax=Desulfobacter vibrioformis TaxID=34031 RepID=UPI0012EBB928|nr:hypothetical protein [Desulfobacter vibrioformis]